MREHKREGLAVDHRRECQERGASASIGSRKYGFMQGSHATTLPLLLRIHCSERSSAVIFGYGWYREFAVLSRLLDILEDNARDHTGIPTARHHSHSP